MILFFLILFVVIVAGVWFGSTPPAKPADYVEPPVSLDGAITVAVSMMFGAAAVVVVLLLLF